MTTVIVWMECKVRLRDRADTSGMCGARQGAEADSTSSAVNLVNATDHPGVMFRLPERQHCFHSSSF